MNKSHFTAIALGFASITLASCGGETAETETAAPDGIEGIEISDARLVLAPVAGNPAAAYFTMSYTGDRNIAIRAVDVSNSGSAQMHRMGEWNLEETMMEMGPMSLEKGETYTFEPGANHVMVYDVEPSVEPGSTVEITFTVAGGDKHSFAAEVRGAGEER